MKRPTKKPKTDPYSFDEEADQEKIDEVNKTGRMDQTDGQETELEIMREQRIADGLKIKRLQQEVSRLTEENRVLQNQVMDKTSQIEHITSLYLEAKNSAEQIKSKTAPPQVQDIVSKEDQRAVTSWKSVQVTSPSELTRIEDTTSIYGMKVNQDTLTLAKQSGERFELSMADKSIKAVTCPLPPRCPFCRSELCCQGLYRVDDCLSLMATYCNCGKRGEPDASGRQHAVAVLQYGVVVNILDTYLEKGLTDVDLVDQDLNDVIWQTKSKVIYRESGSCRLVEYSKDSIGKHPLCQGAYVDLGSSEVKFSSVASAWFHPEESEMSVLFKDGRILSKVGTNSLVFSAFQQFDSWQIITKIFDGLFLLSGITFTSEQKCRVNFILVDLDRQIMTGACSIETKFQRQSSAIGHIYEARRSPDCCILVARSNHEAIYILSCTKAEISLLSTFAVFGVPTSICTVFSDEDILDLAVAYGNRIMTFTLNFCSE